MTTSGRERLDAHNQSVDAEMARLGLCGALHLPTGRRCFRPAGHDDGCRFLEVSGEFGSRTPAGAAVSGGATRAR